VRLRFLGTGTSFGVPQIGCDCAVCRSADPRDRRSRCAVLVEAGGAAILIDTPPELRLQLLGAGVSRLDAVLYTHEHADHIAGMDDLRAFTPKAAAPLPVYGPAETITRLRAAFAYIFDEQPPVPGTSKPRLTAQAIEPGTMLSLAGMSVLPIAFGHGPMRVFGYRFGPLAYITDVKDVPAEALTQLAGVTHLVINALWWRPHPTHLSIPEAVDVARRVGAERTWLTHLTHETAHAALEAALPPGVTPAYDGLIVEVT
jgi:phosphoribosyl 1,2-cyclic phosphate phosphodiesterase